jgi:hypothetical protein
MNEGIQGRRRRAGAQEQIRIDTGNTEDRDDGKDADMKHE